MDSSSPKKVTGRLRLIQALMGFGADSTLNLLYLRRTFGIEKLDPRRRYLFVCNHVSLLDTIMLGGLLWRSGCYPILVLGDKKVWSVSWLHRALSQPIGFLLERGRLRPDRIGELEDFGRCAGDFQLVVFPEGTRGNGVDVGECQPGVYHIAQTAQVSIVPVFIENMHLVSTKTGGFHFFGGLKKVCFHFGEAVEPEDYLSLSREEFTEFIQHRIGALYPRPKVAPVYVPAAEVNNRA
jgi:1-acyl-sn-glycerol-3-phosphate acyltransferase